MNDEKTRRYAGSKFLSRYEEGNRKARDHVREALKWGAMKELFAVMADGGTFRVKVETSEGPCLANPWDPAEDRLGTTFGIQIEITRN